MLSKNNCSLKLIIDNSDLDVISDLFTTSNQMKNQYLYTLDMQKRDLVI